MSNDSLHLTFTSPLRGFVPAGKFECYKKNGT
jgi:hypothetical protein